MSETACKPFRAGRLALRFLALLILLLAVAVAGTGYALWQNNRSVEMPSAQSISQSLENGIRWLANNREALLAKNNVMLWLYVKQSADVTGDERLRVLYSDYKKRHLDPNPKNPWLHLFDAESEAPVFAPALMHYPDYNLYLLYGASCDPVLGKEEIVLKQNDPDYCDEHHPFSPACVTHQMMGVMLAQQRSCLDARVSRELVTALQEKIHRQLARDPRVVDVYIQRLLMLAESGAIQRIKPVWLRRMQEAQLPDGGWDNFHRLFPVAGNRYIGLSHTVEIREPGSNFHATAQGVFLLSLLQKGTSEQR